MTTETHWEIEVSIPGADDWFTTRPTFGTLARAIACKDTIRTEFEARVVEVTISRAVVAERAA